LKANLKNNITDNKFRALMAEAHEGIVLYNKEGEITYASPSSINISGFKDTEMLGTSGMSFVHPDEKEIALKNFAKVLDKAGSSITFKHRLRHKEGNFIWVESTLSNFLHDPTVGGVISNFRDITSQKKAEDELKESKNLLENVNQNIKEAIYRNLPDSSFEYVNEGFLKIFGFSTLEEVNNVEPAHLYVDIAVRKGIRDRLKKLKYISNEEVEFRKKDGSTFIGLMSSVSVKGQDGREYFDGTIRDITELKETEAKLLELNRTLQNKNQELEKREEELSKALAQLSDRNFELDQLVYKTSHDLRSPLSSILGLVHIAKLDDSTTDKTIYIDKIETSIHRLDDFVKSMLNYAKASRIEVKNQEFNINELIAISIDDLRYLENFKDVKVNIEINGSELIKSDELKLKIIISNIISNAYKYMDLNKSDNFLDIKIIHDQKKLKLIIKDNGIGIAEEHQIKIFDMFYRGTERSQGSGLGMYIVKQSIDKLNGEISLSSKFGEGTNFNILIPLNQ